MAISFIGSCEYNSDTDAVSYSITPFSGMTGLADGQVAIIKVACLTTTTGAVTFTGWTEVDEQPGGGAAHQQSTWYRVLSGDSAASSFTFDPPGTPTGICFVCDVYNGVDTTTPFITENGAYSAADADRSLATPTLNNTDANAWWVAAFSSTNGTDKAVVWSADKGTERNQIDSNETTSSRSTAMYDSNGAFATGNITVTGTTDDAGTPNLCAWLGILTPSTGGGATNADAPHNAVSLSVYAGVAGLAAAAGMA